jgi:hypothetical protein
MGTLHYGFERGYAIDIDDRTLAHLQVVIVGKLRRSEGFAFIWSKPSDAGSGRIVLWLAPGIPVRFEFNGGRVPSMNRAWLEQLTVSSMSAQGLQVMPEPPNGNGG